MSIINIAFTYPFALLLLVFSPVIWKFLKSKPLTVELKKFPAISLISKIKSIDNTFENNSLLIIILRFLIFILLVIALSKPYFRDVTKNDELQQVLLIVDDSWESGISWYSKIEKIKSLLDSNSLENISYTLITSSKVNKEKFKFLKNKNSSEILAFINSIKPNSWNSDFSELFKFLEPNLKNFERIFWFTESLISESKKSFFLKIKDNKLKIIETSNKDLPPLIFLKEQEIKGNYNFEIYDFSNFYKNVVIDCYDIKDRLILRKNVKGSDKSNANWNITELTLEISKEFDDSIIYFHFNNLMSSTAKIIKTNISGQKKIGIIQPNYSKKMREFSRANFYIENAMKSNHDISIGSASDLISRKISLMFSDDSDSSIISEEKKIIDWIENGGTFVKFGGEKFLNTINKKLDKRFFGAFEPESDPINLDHELSFRKDLSIKSFKKGSLFYGLVVPEKIKINKYIELKKNLEFKNFQHLAYLENGAPLITEFEIGKGKLVFFHIPANTDWSTLPFSILFVNILEKLNLYSKGVKKNSNNQIFKPFKILDGLGGFEDPSLNTMNLNSKDLKEKSYPLNYQNPPGIYKNKSDVYGLNIPNYLKDKKYSLSFPDEYLINEFDKFEVKNLRKNIIFCILFLFLLETLLTLRNRDIFKIKFFRSSTKFLSLILIFTTVLAFKVQSADEVINKVNTTKLAYVKTGNKVIDEISKNGILSISEYITSKTSVILGFPDEINLDEDDIFFYPILYFPFINSKKTVSEKKIRKIQNFINNGGILIFDCKNNFEKLFIDDCLDDILLSFKDLDITYPIKLQNNNTLSKSFYLLKEFPGRRNQDVFISFNNQINNNEVVSVIFGINDWSGSWAKSKNGFELPILSENEEQRNLSFRFGVNIIIYSLTGNYKSDQVHVPEILKRMN